MRSLGMTFQPTNPPERLVEVARAADAAGVPELWVWEDCFREAGIAQATAALAVTERIRLGIGIMPMPMRNVAVTAMELATIARLFPGRILPGFGHGVQDWMGQIGERVGSPLTLMREYLPAMRALLDGETRTSSGRYVQLDRVALDWPPVERVPVYAAGEGPKTLAATGAVADGTLIPHGWGVEAVRAAVRTVRDGGAGDDHVVVVSLLTAFDDAPDAMESEFRSWALEGDKRVAATGDVDAVAAAVEAYADAGVTTVVLQPRADEQDLAGFAERAGAVARAVGAS